MNSVKALVVLAFTLGVLTFIPAFFAAGAAPPAFVLHKTPKSVTDVSFKDGEGKDFNLSSFKGKLILLNIWATWCGPCRKEMPTLDHLQKQLGGTEFEVVALSIDRAGAVAVQKFYDEIKIEHLKLFIDQRADLMRALSIFGLPTTLLLDRKGQEIGRLIGPTEWDSAEMVAFLRDQIAKAENAQVETEFKTANNLTQVSKE